MTRETTMRFDAVADDGHTTHFTTPAVKGTVETLRVFFTFDNGRGGVVNHVVTLPIEFLDPDGIKVQFTDPPPSAQELRQAGERLVQLAEELRGDE